MDPMEAIKQTFFQECEEQLAELEQGLLAIQGGETDPETVNAVFRAVHSIKGGAGAFGLDELVRFAHVFETTLDHVRSGKLAPEAELLKVMLRAADVLADLVRAARDGGSVDAARSDALLAELNAFSGGEAEAADDDGMGDLVFQPLAFEPLAFEPIAEAAPAEAAADDFDISALLGSILPAAEEPAGQTWIVHFKPSASLYAHANESALLLRELGRMGEAEITLDDSALPALAELDAEGSYLAWTVRLTTDRDDDAIRSVFEWVEDDCELKIEKAGAEAETAADEAFLVPDLDDPEPPLSPVAEGALDIAALIQRAQGAVGGAVGVSPSPRPPRRPRLPARPRRCRPARRPTQTPTPPTQARRAPPSASTWTASTA